MSLQRIPHDTTKYSNNPVELIDIANRQLIGSYIPYPVDSYTKYLFHFNGANNSTTFTDEMGHSVTRVNSPIISTARSKFNGSSMYVGVLNNKIYTPNHDDFEFGSGDFTIDAWVYSTSNSVTGPQFISSYYMGSVSGFTFCLNKTSIGMMIAISGYTNWMINYLSGTYVSLNTWHHVAMVRNGDQWMIFVDGIKRYTNTLSGSILAHDSSLYIGGSMYDTYSGFTGYIDELRISKGIARWINDFTPPTVPYGTIIPSNYIGA